MTRRLAVDEALRSLARDDAWDFQRQVYGPGTPCFKDLAAWFASKGQKVTESSLSTWYGRNRAKYETCPPELALWQTLTGAVDRREQLQAILSQNWSAIAQGFADQAGDPRVALKLLDAIAALDLGTRVAAEQLHNLEVRVRQEEIVLSTIEQVFIYLAAEMTRQGLDSLRMEALEPMCVAISARIAHENNFKNQTAVK
ncbi:MAG: hypothetical protein HC890_07820 [Chloroflexaceae bacterium]|nr:hypothetical protein [Chloroflexaceae bacterium]